MFDFFSAQIIDYRLITHGRIIIQQLVIEYHVELNCNPPAAVLYGKEAFVQ